MKYLRLWSAFLIVAVLWLPSPAHALALIRDTEVENALRDYARPVFLGAGIPPDSVQFFIVNDDAINAFVAGGMNIFVNTGLIIASDTPEMLVGVLAHETGHIAGGHLVRGTQAMERAQIEALATYVLAGLASVAGSGQVGTAVLSAGSHLAEQKLLAFSRSQEQSADQAALGYLDQMGVTAEGMLNMFEKLRNLEQMQFGAAEQFTRTHPLTRERIAHIRAHTTSSPYHESDSPKEWATMHARIRGKLIGFLRPVEEIFTRYPETDTGIEARYARAIALFRSQPLEEALAAVDALLKDFPGDPYFMELKGQMLYEHGRIKEAAPLYEKAVKALPQASLLRVGLADALLAENTPATAAEAITHLRKALELEPDMAGVWRRLSAAYGKSGDSGMAQLALAEEQLLLKRYDDARRYAGQALDQLPEGAPGRVRAADIRDLAERRKKEEKDNR